MPYRPHGRASVSPGFQNPFAICDRCGFVYNKFDGGGGNGLSWQFDYRGPQLQNLKILVCRRCRDVPADQLRPIIIPPDPLPVAQPRPENYAQDNYGGISPEMAAQPPPYVTSLG